MDETTPLTFLFVLAAAFVVYFIPNWISTIRNHHQAWPIFWVNLLLGWTVLGWLAAFIWSLSAIKQDLLTEGRISCPHCAELVKREAKVCKHCGRDIVHPSKPRTAASQKKVTPPRRSKPVTGSRIGLKMSQQAKEALAYDMGIRQQGREWVWKGQRYTNLDVALKFVEAQKEKQRGAAT